MSSLDVTTVKKLLLEGDETSDEAISFYIETVQGLIALECEEEAIPEQFENIATMAVVAMCNQRGNEGYNNSKEGDVTLDIARDILSPYRQYFQAFVQAKAGNGSKVVFL